MKRITRNILITLGGLLLAGIIAAISFDFNRLIPPKTSGPCFDEEYWNKKAGKHPKQQDKKNLETSSLLNLAELAEKRKEAMVDSAHHTYSNAEMWNIMYDATLAIMDTSALYQSRIKSILKDEALNAYNAERIAFSEWQRYQKTIAADVIVEIWELYSGGTAGGTLEIMHPYNIANPDAMEQEILYNALMNTAMAAPYKGTATMEQIAEAKNNLMNSLSATYSMIDSENDWRYIKHTAAEEDAFLSDDLMLFKKWIAAREYLAEYFDEDVRTIYSSQTGFWLFLLLNNYEEEFGAR